jgi:PadR family transcriptional regulator AphA
MKALRLSLTEWAVLAILAERAAHPFAVARLLAEDGELGRVLTVRRPLVYRAAERLSAAGLCRPDHTEPGAGGPERTVYRVTTTGRRALAKWLAEPVTHVRDLRLEFLLKVRLVRRAGKPPLPLVRAQQAALERRLEALAGDDADDEVTLWRRRNARAAAEFLWDLEKRFSGPEEPPPVGLPR